MNSRCGEVSSPRMTSANLAVLFRLLSEQNAVYVLELVNALVKASSVCDLVFQSAATLLDFMLLLAP